MPPTGRAAARTVTRRRLVTRDDSNRLESQVHAGWLSCRQVAFVRIMAREELAHARAERDLLRLTRGDQATIEGADNHVAPGCDQRPHVERGTDGRAPHPTRAAGIAGVPLSRASGATPISAAICFRFKCPTCGRSASSVRLTTEPTPGLGECPVAFAKSRMCSHQSVEEADPARDEPA